jgi:hypothetical protein
MSLLILLTGSAAGGKTRTSDDSLATLAEAAARAFVGTRAPGDSLATLAEAPTRKGDFVRREHRPSD